MIRAFGRLGNAAWKQWYQFLNRRIDDEAFREHYFDSSPRHSFLLSTLASESYLVSSDDRVIGRECYVRGSFDFEKMTKATKLLKGTRTNNLLIDIGANIGTICIPAVRRGIFKNAIAIEPEPLNFGLLSANILMNGLTSKIKAHNIALGNESGKHLLMRRSQENFGDHQTEVVGVDANLDESTIRVPCERMDSIISVVDPSAALVWMDTQGFEGYVLDGATELLKSRIPLVLEFWPQGLKRTGCFGLLKESLISAGYSCFHDLSTESASRRLCEKELENLYNSLGEDDAFTDILVQ